MCNVSLFFFEASTTLVITGIIFCPRTHNNIRINGIITFEPEY
jgi:hypothetical protein